MAIFRYNTIIHITSYISSDIFNMTLKNMLTFVLISINKILKVKILEKRPTDRGVS